MELLGEPGVYAPHEGDAAKGVDATFPETQLGELPF